MPAINPAHRLPNVVDPATDTVAVDLECRRCGYNLRTQHEQSVCPECGSPVGLSTRGNFLQYANPEWVAKVAKGLQIVFWMIIVEIALSVCFGNTITPIAPVIDVLTTIINVFGVWLMTEPDPSGIGEEKNVSARKIVRISAVLAAASVALDNALETGSAALPDTFVALLTIIGVATVLAQLVAFIAQYTYFAIIARRIPNEALVVRSMMIQKSMIVFMVVAIVAAIISELAGSAADIALIFFLPVAIGALIFGIMTIVLIYRLQVAVTNEANAARVNWAADTYQSPPPMPPTAPPPTDA